MFKKGQELAEDLRDKYETSDHPFVHRVEDVKERLFSESGTAQVMGDAGRRLGWPQAGLAAGSRAAGSKLGWQQASGHQAGLAAGHTLQAPCCALHGWLMHPGLTSVHRAVPHLPLPRPPPPSGGIYLHGLVQQEPVPSRTALNHVHSSALHLATPFSDHSGLVHACQAWVHVNVHTGTCAQTVL